MSKTLEQYSTEELAEIMDGLDRDKYLERYNEVAQVIDARMEGIIQEDEKQNQAIIEEAESLSDSMTWGKSAFYVLCSLFLSILPFWYLHTGEFSRRLRRVYSMADDPIVYWFSVGALIFVAALPLVLIVKGVFKNIKAKDNTSVEQH